MGTVAGDSPWSLWGRQSRSEWPETQGRTRCGCTHTHTRKCALRGLRTRYVPDPTFLCPLFEAECFSGQCESWLSPRASCESAQGKTKEPLTECAGGGDEMICRNKSREQRLNLSRSWYKDHSRAYNTS